jgi:hypothetical protein
MSAGRTAAVSLPPPARALRAESWIVFAALFLTYAYFIQGGGPAPNSRFVLVTAIAEHGTFRIDRYQTATIDKALYDGHYYSDKAPGLSLAAVPVYLATKPVVLNLLRGRADASLMVTVTLHLCTLFTVGLVSAIGGVLLWRILMRLGAAPADGLLTALAFSLATPAFAYSTLFMSHQFSAGLLVAALYCVMRAREPQCARRPHWMLAAGACVGLSVISEFATAIIGAMIGAYLIAGLKRKQEVAWFLAGGLPFAVFLGWYNNVCFGSPLAFGYEYEADPSFREAMAHGFLGISWPSPDALWGMLFGAGRGLLRLSPFLALGFAGFWFLARERARRAEFALSCAVVIVYLLYGAGYYMWWGGSSMGPRHIIPMLPFLALPMTRVVPRIRRIAAGLVVISALIVLLATAVQPEFPDPHALPLSVNPVTTMVIPHFLEGYVSTKALMPDSTVSGIPYVHPERRSEREWDSFNLGEAMGITGPASLMPLIPVYAALIALFWRSRRDMSL